MPTHSAPSTSPSASPSAAAETFTPGAPAGQCLTANLAVTIEAEGSSAGHQHATIVFTNKGASCVLEGFPAVQVIANGVPMGSSAGQDSSASSAPVTLASGGAASSELASINIDPGGGPLGDTCVVGHGDGYNITPPHSLLPILVPVSDTPACTNGVAWMTVGTLTAHQQPALHRSGRVGASCGSVGT